MFEVLEKSSGKVVGMKVSGTLVHENYAQFVPKLEKLIEEHGSIRCYCELSNFHGITPHGFWDELKFDIKHCKNIERCAIVGDPSWHQWMTKISKMIFSGAQIKYFDESQSEEAWQWIYEGVESNSQTEPETTTASV